MAQIKLERIAESWSAQSILIIDVQWKALRMFYQRVNLSGDDEQALVVDTPLTRSRPKVQGPLSFGFSTIEYTSLTAQGIPCKITKVVFHEPVGVFTDGKNIAVTASIDGDSIVQILGVESSMASIKSLIKVEETGNPMPQQGELPRAIICNID
jgi:hypothetical protein